METYERIRFLRKNHLKLTQEVFAKKINISRANLGNIETNRINITERVILDICKEFNVNYQWLTTGEGEIIPETDIDMWEDFFNELELNSQLDDLDKKIIKTYIELPMEYRKVFRNYLKSMVDTGHAEYMDDVKNNTAKQEEPSLKKYKPAHSDMEIGSNLMDIEEENANKFTKIKYKT